MRVWLLLMKFITCNSERDLVSALNARFRAGTPSDDPASAGVVVHSFDDRDKHLVSQLGYGESVWRSFFNSTKNTSKRKRQIVSCSIMNAQLPFFYRGEWYGLPLPTPYLEPEPKPKPEPSLRLSLSPSVGEGREAKVPALCYVHRRSSAPCFAAILATLVPTLHNVLTTGVLRTRACRAAHRRVTKKNLEQLDGRGREAWNRTRPP